jgi:hypothetical protein
MGILVLCAFVPLCLCNLGRLVLWAFVPLAWDEFSLVARIFLAFLGFSYIFSMYVCLLHVTDGTCVRWRSFGANSL